MRAGGPALLFETRRRVALPAADQHLRHAPAHVVGAGRRRSRRARARDPRAGRGRSRRPGLMDKLRMLPKLARVASATPKTVRTAPCQQVVETDVDLGDAADPHHLAGGRRPLHHAADGDHARSRQGDAQRRLLPDAGLRPAHHRHALAAAQDRPPPHAPLQGAGPAAHAGRGRAGRRSGAALRGDRAAARRHRRVPVRRVPAPQAGRDGALQDQRPGGARVGRLRAGRLRRRRRAAPRGAVRRSHRLLLAGRRLPGLPRHRDHAARDRRSTRPPSSGRRRRRTPGWARRPSGSSCRCCR